MIKMVQQIINVRVYETDMLQLTMSFNGDGKLSILGVKSKEEGYELTIDISAKYLYIKKDITVQFDQSDEIIINYKDEELHIVIDECNDDSLMGYGSILFCKGTKYRRLPANGVEASYKITH